MSSTQTLKVTALGNLVKGDLVNLERALRIGDRLGGHFVQGHVDSVGVIKRYQQQGQDHLLEITIPDLIAELSVPKGSLTVNGISLTIAELNDNDAQLWIIPHTHSHTNLQTSRAKQEVNLEADLLAKHVANLMKKKVP